MDAHEKRLLSWWAGLLALTIISMEGAPALGSKAVLAPFVLLIAFVKARIVVREFMEVRSAPLALRLVLDGWGVGICLALILMVA